MSERTTYVPGTPSWVDMGSPDPAAAAACSSAASAFATVTYTDQNGGISGFCAGPSPATDFPRNVAIA